MGCARSLGLAATASRSASALAIAFGLVAAPSGADAVLPSGGQLVAGSASIGPAVGGTLTIDQQSQRAVIDWQRFSIGAGGLVQVNNGAGATLNRVLSGDPSSIMGRLAATGSVWLVNPAGVVVGPSGQVTTGGDFVASARMIGAEAFMAGGSLVAEGAGGRIANAGSIATGGDTVLIGAMVENSGRVAAGGQAALLAAGRVVLREAGGDSRIHVEHVSGEAGDVSTSGRIEAAAAELRAVSGNVYALAADTSGVVRATAADLSGGRIRLVAGRDAVISGVLDASGTSGGTIDITAGERVILGEGAEVAARGAGGAGGDGGRIRVGGARQGGLPGETEPLAAAQAVFVEQGARIDAESAAGRGGEVILWSERRTRFDGQIRADGPQGGGFVETSSKDMLQITSGRVLVGNGQWLLDPRNVIIVATAGVNPGPPTPPDWVINPPAGPDNYQINRDPLRNALDAGTNVTVTTAAPGTQPGNITVSAIFEWSGSGNLTLLADANIAVNQRVQTLGAGSLFLNAGRAITLGLNGLLRSDGSGDIVLKAGTDVFLTGADILSTGSGGIFVTAQNEIVINRGISATGSGDVRLTAFGPGIRYQIPSTAGNRLISANTGAVTLEAPGPEGDIVLFRGTTANNIQVRSNTGSVTLSAGRDVIVRSVVDGGWVRIGREDQASPVSVTAGRNIILEGNGASARGDAFAEIASRGAVTLTAGSRIVLDAGGDTQSAARVTAVGPSLVVTAPQGDFAGRVRSRGDTLFQGGDFRFKVKPDFLLDPDRSFTLAEKSSITSVPMLEIRAPGAGNISLLGPVDGFDFLGVAGADFTIGAPITMLGSNVFNTALVVVAGRRIINTAGASPLSAPNNRWLTYSVSPFDDVGEEDLNPDTFNLYNRTFTANPPDTILPLKQSRRIYSFQPTLTLTAESATKRAGTEGPPLGFTVDGLVPGDLLENALSGTPEVTSAGQPATAPAGTYPTVFTPGLAATDQGYLLVLVPGVLTVQQAILLITAADTSKVYGQPDPALVYTATGFLPGDDESIITGSLARAPGEDVGVYAIQLGTLAAPGYEIQFTPGSFTIVPAGLVVTADAKAKVYGDPDPALTFAVSGLAPGDTEADVLSGALARAPGEAVGSYAITQGSLASNANYVLTFVGSFLSITPRDILLSLVGQVVRVYDATVVAPVTADNLLLSGVLQGDEVGVTFADAVYDTANVGTGKLVTVQGVQLTGASAGNYRLTGQPSANIGIITPAPLIVTALDAERLFGQPNPPFTLVPQGLRGSDTLASIGISAVTTATIQSPPGFYPIDVVGQPLNYTVTRVPGELTVLPLPLQGAVVQQGTVPVAGGLIQQGVATGVNALNDTLRVQPAVPVPPATARLLRTTRYTVSVELAPAAPAGLGGASGFDPAAASPGLQ